MLAYQHASYANESVVQENAHLRLEMDRRLSGWGWGEVHRSGRCPTTIRVPISGPVAP